MRRRKGLEDLAQAIEEDNSSRSAPATAPPPSAGEGRGAGTPAADGNRDSETSRRGRPRVDAVGLHLRMDRELDGWLQDQAIEESRRRRKTVTKQAMIVDLLERARKAATSG